MTQLVSVVVPCFNYGRHLQQCVQSLAVQTHTAWECIIVDDGSTDDTPSICAGLARADPRVTFVRQENRGLSAARNTGLQRARGEFLQLLDADDLLEPRKLSSQVAHLEAHRGVDIVLGDVAFFDGAAPGRLRKWRREGATGETRPVRGQGEPVVAALVAGNICVVHAALLRRRVIESVGSFDESLRSHEDWEFWMRCALAGCNFDFISAANGRALVREHAVSMSRTRDTMLTSGIAVRERARGRLPPPLESQNELRLADLKCRLGIERVRQGRREGWALYREGLRGTRWKPASLARLLLLVPGAAWAARLGRRAVAALFPA